MREAVTACVDAGIRVLMITGDHPATAEAVARDAGLGAAPKVVTAEAVNGDVLSSAADIADIDIVGG